MRIRTVKPEFFTHEGLFEAEKETGLPIRIAFVGLWCAADREGRFRWQPRRLGVQIMPYDQADFSRVLHACLTRGFVVAYRVNGEVFGVIPSFTKHQIINNREAESILPAPDSENAELLTKPEEVDAFPTRAPRVPHATLTCTSGREGKGREGNMEGKGKEGGTASRFVRPTREELSLEAAKIGLPEAEVTKFVLHYESNGWKVGKTPMKSWTHSLAGWATRWREKTYTHTNGATFTTRIGTSTPSDAPFFSEIP